MSEIIPYSPRCNMDRSFSCLQALELGGIDWPDRSHTLGKERHELEECYSGPCKAIGRGWAGSRSHLSPLGHVASHGPRGPLGQPPGPTSLPQAITKWMYNFPLFSSSPKARGKGRLRENRPCVHLPSPPPESSKASSLACVRGKEESLNHT